MATKPSSTIDTLDDLKIDLAHAEAIIELGLKYGATEIGEIPSAKKDKIAEAKNIVAFSVDSYINGGLRPDDDEAEVAEAGEKIQEILDIAGVVIEIEGEGDDEEAEVSFEDPPELDAEDEESEDADEDDEDEDDEAPFDPDDYITGYTEMSVSSKVKAIKALDYDDDEDVATMEAIAEWEKEQDKPSSRVLNYIEETLEVEDEEEEEDEESESEDGEDEVEGEATEEPWDGYDKSSAVEIKNVLNAQMKDEDEPLTAEQVSYVMEYEQSREKPPPRKRVIKLCEELLAELEAAEDEADEEESEEEAPAKGSIAAARAKRQKGKTADKTSTNGSITLTREQILEALSEGEVTITV